MSFFGKNIKKIRGLNNLSQQEFGNLFGLSRASIGSYEEERADPKIDALIKIAQHFKLNIHELLTTELHALEKNKEEPKSAIAGTAKSYLEDRVESLEAKLEKLENLLNQSK
jgi:transcriptional regulator with XRE-family HTH domain